MSTQDQMSTEKSRHDKALSFLTVHAIWVAICIEIFLIYWFCDTSSWSPTKACKISLLPVGWTVNTCTSLVFNIWVVDSLYVRCMVSCNRNRRMSRKSREGGRDSARKRRCGRLAENPLKAMNNGRYCCLCLCWILPTWEPGGGALIDRQLF